MVSVATGCYDWMKENMYYFFGPVIANRLVGTACGVAVAGVLSMPFDTIKTRMHTMRPLPNGVYPYTSSADCAYKIFRYECQSKKLSNAGSFYSGGQAYFVRLYTIALLSQFLLDFYFGSNVMQEFWQPARYKYQGGLDYDIHNPYT